MFPDRSLTLLCVAALTVAVVGPAVRAQETDDWDVAVDPAQDLTVASASFSGNRTVAVQCMAGKLDVVIAGIPHGGSEWRSFDVSRRDGRRDRQAWTTGGPDEPLRSVTPGRDARFLKSAGQLSMRSRQAPDSDPAEYQPLRIELELPEQSTGIDRVLHACGRALEDSRDTLPFLDGLLRRPRIFPRPPTGSNVRNISTFYADVSCVLGDRERLAECRVEEERPAGSGYGERSVREANGKRLDLDKALARPGSVIYFSFVSQER